MADSIFYGGDVISVSGPPEDWDVAVVAVKDGRICALGQSLEEVSHLRQNSTKMIDLKGATLLPGMIEPHTHPCYGAYMNNLAVNISGMQTPLPKRKPGTRSNKPSGTRPQGEQLKSVL